MAHNLSSWPLLECICLPPREAQSRVTRSILEPVILQVFGLLIYSVKIFFACGGHEGVRSQCPVAMAPVAHARARVVVDHRQVRLMIGGSACCTIVLTLRWRAAHLTQHLDVGKRQCHKAVCSLAPRRLRHAPPQPARRSLRLVVDFFLLLRFLAVSWHLGGAGGGPAEHHFSRILRFVCLKTRKIFWPRRGGRSQDRELGL